jgi:hypothetical protein
VSFLIRIRTWRTRRKDRKAEELLALAALSPEDRDAERVQERVRDDWWKGQLVELGGQTPAGMRERKGDPRNTDPPANSASPLPPTSLHGEAESGTRTTRGDPATPENGSRIAGDVAGDDRAGGVRARYPA